MYAFQPAELTPPTPVRQPEKLKPVNQAEASVLDNSSTRKLQPPNNGSGSSRSGAKPQSDVSGYLRLVRTRERYRSKNSWLRLRGESPDDGTVACFRVDGWEQWGAHWENSSFQQHNNTLSWFTLRLKEATSRGICF